MTIQLGETTLHELGKRREAIRGAPNCVLQFGTGGFLRGFAEYFIQRAVQQGRLEGGVAVVGSTGSGRIHELVSQDCLFTLLIRGRQSGRLVDDSEIVSVVNHALSAGDQWSDVLSVARQPNLELVVSNTTEVGIAFDEGDRIDLNPPRSFPGKLTAFLYERALAFDFDANEGVIVLPCELIDANGDALRNIVLKLSERWGLGDDFASWIHRANTFCNTLVDRIVPGTPREIERKDIEDWLGYRDALLTVAEPYRLWAIEGDAAFAERFPLSGVDPGIVVAENIKPFRERKVRILNGMHTVTAPAAILAGFKTVGDMVGDPIFGNFIRSIAFREIVPSLDSDSGDAGRFAEDVLQRFSNPFIRHELIDITFQQTRKLRVRVIPTVMGYARRFGMAPPAITFGLACFFLYNHPAYRPRGPRDDSFEYWTRIWEGQSTSSADDVTSVVRAIAGDESMWGCRLDCVDGLVQQIADHILSVEETGVEASITTYLDSVKV